jgi:glucose/arabinose dehydrogenase
MNPMTPLRCVLGIALAAALVAGCGNVVQPTASGRPSPSAATPTASAAASPGAPSASASVAEVPASGAASSPFDPTGLTVTLKPVADGFRSPLAAVSAKDDSGRLFVVEQGGLIRIVRDGAILPGPFLDLSGQISSGGEQGLLGLAFHPDFPADPRFFVDYTDPNGDTRVSSFTVDPSNPDRANAASEKRLLFVDQPYANHNGGALAFGPDGDLYIALGDGGSGGDPHENGQKLSTMLGKILRIGVDGTTGELPYAIPDDNPYVNKAGSEPTIFLYGLRNPWRLSFDRATGDLWVGDVGQNAWEEIDVARAGTSGENFGWNRMEATHCFRPASGCDQTGLTPPVAEYSHDAGCTVIGGYVYRGSAQPALAGGYLFGDYCSGTIWAIDPAGDQLREPTVVAQTDASISSFGEDEAGELYVTDISGGRLLRVVASRG